MDELIVGGVDEHFNISWHLGIEHKHFKSEGIDLKWITFYGGTGEMTQSLRNGEVDACVVLTEGIVADQIKGNPSKIISKYVISPLVWGIHTANKSEVTEQNQIYSQKYAISRMGSGSHLMALVDAHQKGHQLSKDQFVSVGNLNGALQSLTSGESQVFFWEKYTTIPYVQEEILRRVGEFITPWPSFVIAATEEAIHHKSRALSRMLKTIYFLNRHFMAAEDAVDLVRKKYGNAQETLNEWFYSTEWATSSEISSKMLDNVIHQLHHAGIIDQKKSPLHMCHRLL